MPSIGLTNYDRMVHKEVEDSYVHENEAYPNVAVANPNSVEIWNSQRLTHMR